VRGVALAPTVGLARGAAVLDQQFQIQKAANDTKPE